MSIIHPIQYIKDKLRIPVIAAPMFLISNTDMALQCCYNGVVGSFPALNQRTSDGLELWLKQMQEGLEAQKCAVPYAVNLIVNAANQRLLADLKLCVHYKVPVIITSLGINKDLIDAVHAYGGIVLHDVTKIRHAQKAVEAGVDGLIAVGAGAGGHAGTINPFALVNEIRGFFDGFLALAGSISTGRDVFAAQAMGADVAYMGTRFINAAESQASRGYKEMIVKASASDILYTDAVSGVSANFLSQSLENAGFNLDNIAGSRSEEATLSILADEAKAWKTIWSAGHGVGSIHDTSAIEYIISSLAMEYKQARDLF